MKKIDLKVIFLIIMFVPFFPLTYLEIAIPLANEIYNILLVIDYLIIILLYSYNHDYKNILFILCFLLFGVTIIFSTYKQDGEVLEYIKQLITYLMIILFFNIGIKKYREKFLKAMSIFFISINSINFITIIMYPEGMYINGVGAWANWFLGYKNGFILYLIPNIISSYFYDRITKNKISPITIITIIISIITLILSDSSTGIVGLAILLFVIVFRKALNKLKVFNLKNCIIIYLVLFFAIIIFRVQEIFSYLIVDILHKNLDFTNRTYIWDTALEYIKDNFIFGYGYESSKIRTIKFAYSQAVTCHNQLLDFLYQGGMLGVTFISFMISSLNKKIKKCDNDETKVVITGCILAYLIMMLTEYYNFQYYIFMFVIFLNMYRFNIEKN